MCIYVYVHICVCLCVSVSVYWGVLLENEPKVFYKLSKLSTAEPPPQVLFLKLHKKYFLYLCVSVHSHLHATACV